MRSKEELEALKVVKDKLKECKQEWLEKNVKGQPALGVLTVQQILDNAVEGVTTWSFVIDKEWREEVMKFNKNGGQWSFDGYVYHVRGTLVIDGIGSRMQYGSKVAVGGKDNQNSSYKAAASDCLKKCASLFGVGSSIYSKIKVESDEQDNSYNNYNEQQQWGAQQQQAQQPQQQQMYVNNDGFHQQGEYIWYNNAWVHQNEYYAMKQQQQQVQANQGGQYASTGLTEQQQADWYTQTMQTHDPQGYQQMVQNAGAPRVDQEQQQMTQAMQVADNAVASGSTDYPFENVPPKTEEVKQQDFQATPQAEAQAQAEVKQQDFKAVQYGAPVDPKEQQPEQAKEQKDPLEHVKADNPWDTPEMIAELNVFKQHKERLAITQDSLLLPHVREYFKDETATIASITPDTLIGFNAHLQNIQA